MEIPPDFIRKYEGFVDYFHVFISQFLISYLYFQPSPCDFIYFWADYTLLIRYEKPWIPCENYNDPLPVLFFSNKIKGPGR